MSFRCIYFSPMLDKCGVMDEPRLSATTERHKLSLNAPALAPVAGSALEACGGASGIVMEMGLGWARRPQIALASTALSRSQRVWFYWPKEGVVEVVDTERVRSWKRHWRFIMAAGQVILAWSPYLLLVACVLIWGYEQKALDTTSKLIPWPGLHNQIARIPPVTVKVSPYGAVFNLNWLSAAGTSCMIATLFTGLILRVPPGRFLKILGQTLRQLALPLVTLAAVLGLAFLMNYCGATATLGLAFAATGASFPFFSSILGWMGVFLTGSDTSANALFGNLQVVTASKLGLNPVLMAASNSSGGVMGKMISLSSIAVAAAATHMARDDEAKLFRFTLKHSVLLASLIGLIVLFYAYVAPSLQP